MKKIVLAVLAASFLMLCIVSIGLSCIMAYKAEMDVRISQVQIEQIQDSLNIQRPTYEYLCSVTVPIIGQKGSEKWMGTGVIIKITEKYTYIITNNHVAPNDADRIQVIDMKVVDAENVKNDGIVADLAIIRVPGKLNNRQEVNGYSIGYPQDKIYSVGMYLGLPYIYTEGTFAGYQGSDVLVNMPSLFGCSGSGIFDKDGNLIALLYAGNQSGFMAMDTAKAICVPIQDILHFIEETVNQK